MTHFYFEKFVLRLLFVFFLFNVLIENSCSQNEDDYDNIDNDCDQARLHRMLERVRSERNKQLILEELNLHLQNETLFLELASGAGQLVSFLAKNSPDITFQPSETNKSFMENILRLKHKFRLKNLLEPIYLDPCSDPDTWFVDEKPENCSIDYIFNSNTVHVNHYNCTKEIFRGAHRYLRAKGMLFFYGPFAYGTVRSPECNKNLDKLLLKCNPEWGMRDAYREMSRDAAKFNFYLDRTHFLPEPAYTELLVWKRKHDALSQRAEFLYQQNIKE